MIIYLPILFIPPFATLCLQVSPTQTRVLIDMPCATFQEKNKQEGGLREYFRVRRKVTPIFLSCLTPQSLRLNSLLIKHIHYHRLLSVVN